MTSDPAGLYTAALTLTNERRYREAEAALDAAASGADDNLRARIAGTRAFVLDQLGRPDEGEALCRRVLAGDALTAHTRGVTEGQLGSILMHRGRLDEGLEWLGRAIDTIPDDPLAVANLRMNRSLVAMQRGQLAAATADLEAAVAAYERHGDPVEVESDYRDTFDLHSVVCVDVSFTPGRVVAVEVREERRVRDRGGVEGEEAADRERADEREQRDHRRSARHGAHLRDGLFQDRLRRSGLRDERVDESLTLRH